MKFQVEFELSLRSEIKFSCSFRLKKNALSNTNHSHYSNKLPSLLPPGFYYLPYLRDFPLEEGPDHKNSKNLISYPCLELEDPTAIYSAICEADGSEYSPVKLPKIPLKMTSHGGLGQLENGIQNSSLPMINGTISNIPLSNTTMSNEYIVEFGQLSTAIHDHNIRLDFNAMDEYRYGYGSEIDGTPVAEFSPNGLVIYPDLSSVGLEPHNPPLNIMVPPVPFHPQHDMRFNRFSPSRGPLFPMNLELPSQEFLLSDDNLAEDSGTPSSSTTLWNDNAISLNVIDKEFTERPNQARSDVTRCDFCEKTFSGKWQGVNMLRHVRSLHKNTKVQCQYCMKPYKRSDALIKHQRAKHPNKNIPGPKRRKSLMVIKRE